jgi:tRNA-dihydrouridine synthase 3
VVAALAAAGCAAVTVHGRTMQARYKRPADWAAVQAVAAAQGASPGGGLPVIGNGDVLTGFEFRRRLDEHGCLAVMAGRGALIRPWLMQEAAEGGEWAPSASERVGVYRRLVSHMKEHFGDDARGKSKAFYFLPWHMGWLARYRPTPESAFGAASRERALLTRRFDLAVAEAGEDVGSLPPLERLLRCEAESAMGPLADALWEAGSDAEACAALEALAREHLGGWEAEVAGGGRGRDGDDRDDRDERQPEG